MLRPTSWSPSTRHPSGRQRAAAQALQDRPGSGLHQQKPGRAQPNRLQPKLAISLDNRPLRLAEDGQREQKLWRPHKIPLPQPSSRGSESIRLTTPHPRQSRQYLAEDGQRIEAHNRTAVVSAGASLIEPGHLRPASPCPLTWPSTYLRSASVASPYHHLKSISLYRRLADHKQPPTFPDSPSLSATSPSRLDEDGQHDETLSKPCKSL